MGSARKAASARRRRTQPLAGLRLAKLPAGAPSSPPLRCEDSVTTAPSSPTRTASKRRSRCGDSDDEDVAELRPEFAYREIPREMLEGADVDLSVSNTSRWTRPTIPLVVRVTHVRLVMLVDLVGCRYGRLRRPPRHSLQLLGPLQQQPGRGCRPRLVVVVPIATNSTSAAKLRRCVPGASTGARVVSSALRRS